VKYILDKETLRERYTQRTGGRLCAAHVRSKRISISRCAHTRPDFSL
jgi:hypothetical protein